MISMETGPEVPDTVLEDTGKVGMTQVEDTLNYTQTEDTPKKADDIPNRKRKKEEETWLNRLQDTANNDDTPNTKIQKMRSQLEEARRHFEENKIPEEEETLKEMDLQELLDSVS